LKILVAGSEGFIGGHCVDYFMQHKHEVTGIDLYEQPSKKYNYIKVSRLSPEMDEVLAQNKFDAVVNAAGSGNVPYSMTHPVLDFEANSLDTIRLLDAIRKHQPACKYIHLSSAAVYGNPQKLPIKEEDVAAPLSPYGWHKLVSENLCKEYTHIYHLHTAVLRPFSVYGPGLKKQLFWDLFVKASRANGSFDLFGTGKESRDYIFVKDLVRGIDAVLQQGAMQGEVYNLASGIETRIEEAVQTYFDALQIKPAYRFNGTIREGDPLNWRADISRIKQLGFSLQYNLSSGLAELAKWVKKVNG
jgi:nucleoside-diphosphate-sugar epimerase